MLPPSKSLVSQYVKVIKTFPELDRSINQYSTYIPIVTNTAEYLQALEDARSGNLGKLQSEEICLAAVNKNGLALEHVKHQTDEICLAAVNKNGLALKFVKHQTDEICLAAVKQNVLALVYVQH